VQLKWIFIGLSVVGIFASSIIVNRFSELEEDRLGADTFGARMEIGHLIVSHITNIPFLGYGAGTAQQILEKKYNISTVPHNDYLRITLEMGLVGLFMYITLITKELVKSVINRRYSKAWHVNYFTMAMIVYFIIISFAQNIIHDVTIFPLFLVCCHLAKQYTLLYRKQE
jgi:O-antigen ligase